MISLLSALAGYGSILRYSPLIFKEDGTVAFHGGITTHLMKVLPSSTVMFGTFGTFFSCHRRIAASTGMQLILALDNRANVMSNKEECVVVDDSTARPPFHR